MASSSEQRMPGSILARIRLDFLGETQPKFFFGRKNGEKAAEEKREQKATLLRNVPYQGIVIEDIDLSLEVYQVYDTSLDEQVYYAPIIVTLWASSLEDLIRFIIKEEFRKIEILQPHEMILSGKAVEKLLFKISEEIKLDRLSLETWKGR